MKRRELSFGDSRWIDLTDAAEPGLTAAFAALGADAALAADCLDPSALPKLIRFPGGCFLMLRAFDEKAAPQASSAQSLTRKLALLWGDGFVLSVHRSEMGWLNRIFAGWERRPERKAAALGELVHEILEECLFSYEKPVDSDTEAITELEGRIFADRSTRAAPGAMLETAYLVKKRAFALKRLLRLTRDLLPGISRIGEPASASLQSLKEEADRIFFYADDLAESANDLVQLSISMSSNRMNELVRLLTIVSLFLLPLNLVTGVYGMNFEFMPELHRREAYPAVLLAMALIVTGIYLFLRSRGWIRRRG